MPKIEFYRYPDNKIVVEGKIGESIMRAAIANGIDGIVADCGGACSCGTCHVYVGSETLAKLPPPSDMEVTMLNYTADERRSNSRLSCQIIVNGDIDRYVLELPSKQVDY